MRRFLSETMRSFILVWLVVSSAVAGAAADLRTGAPKDCHLYAWGRGPNGTTQVATEFRLAVLDRKMPSVDDQYVATLEAGRVR